MPKPQKIKRKKKNRKKKKQRYCPEEEEEEEEEGEKKKKKIQANTWAFLSIKKKCIPTAFSLHFGEKTFWWV